MPGLSMAPPQDRPLISFDKASILERLALLRRYHLNPPAPLADVEAFEKKHNITLPEDYKYFISQIGNRSEAPHEVFPLGEWAFNEFSHKIDDPDWKIIGDLGQPFPHTEEWSPESIGTPRPEPPPDTSPEDEERMIDEWEEEFAKACEDPALMNGAFPIHHLGCGDSQWLVVNGPQKGYVWNNYGYGGISPVRGADGRQMTFSDWYLSGLQAVGDQRLSGIGRRVLAGYKARGLPKWLYGMAAGVGLMIGACSSSLMGRENRDVALALTIVFAFGGWQLVAMLDRRLQLKRAGLRDDQPEVRLD